VSAALMEIDNDSTENTLHRPISEERKGFTVV